MKDTFKSLNFKPAAIKSCMEDESKYHKAKIVGFSLLMAGIATTYQSYFNGLVYRSGMYQQRALAGLEDFTDFIDGKNPEELWQMKNELDVLEGRDFKALKYMHTGGSVNKFQENFWDANSSTDAWTELGMNFEEPKPSWNGKGSGNAITRGQGQTGDG